YLSALHWCLYSFPTRRSSDLLVRVLDHIYVRRNADTAVVLVAEVARWAALEFLDFLCSLVNILDRDLQVLCDRLIVVFFEISEIDRKSTRLNSSHVKISYAVF